MSNFIHPVEPKPPSYFDEDYFIRGIETGKSNYQSFRWLPDASLTLSNYIQRHLRIATGESVLDYGCALGMVVKALRMHGVDARGYDHAEWPIQNCDPSVIPYVSNTLPTEPLSVDHCMAKDVLEHMSLVQISEVLPALCRLTRKSILIIVPLTQYFGGQYLRPEDEADPSHVIRFTLDDWLKTLSPLAEGFSVYGSYHLEGLKPASSQVPYSCGFFKLVRCS